MDFTPKQHYVPAKQEEGDKEFNVYHRREDGSLAKDVASNVTSHKDAIMMVKEALVAEGDGLENKAILATIQGGKV